MSSPRRIEISHSDQAIHQNTAGCLTPTTVKVGAVVFGLLFIGAGLALYFLHVNAIAAYVTGGIGGTSILGVVMWSIIGCIRDKNEDNRVEDKSVGVNQNLLPPSDSVKELKIA